MRIAVVVNGDPVEAEVWEGESLLYALREHMGLPGSKNACEQGECGSCSVLLDGTLHPVQEAFTTTGAVQCGFCTPGLIVATVDLLARVPQPTDDEIREALSGNLCRCTGYAKIFDAVRMAAGS